MTNINVEIHSDHVATVEIDRPPFNYLDEELMQDLVRALQELDEDNSVRTSVICSKGKAFCAGRDFGESQSEVSSTDQLYESVEQLFRIRKPTVAAIQGAAVGGGLGLALSADFRVAADEARFVASFSRLGFHHGFGLTVTLPLIAGPQCAMEMLLTGRRIHGEEALRVGLCDRLVPLEDVRKEAHRLAADMAKSAPLALLAIRKTMRSGIAEKVADAMANEAEQQAILKRTVDFKEGVRSMSERRTPKFLGQ